MLGTNRIAKSPSPKTNSMEAPGQCMILNKIPSTVKQIDNAPEINANVFILLNLIILIVWLFGVAPFF